MYIINTHVITKMVFVLKKSVAVDLEKKDNAAIATTENKLQ